MSVLSLTDNRSYLAWNNLLGEHLSAISAEESKNISHMIRNIVWEYAYMKRNGAVCNSTSKITRAEISSMSTKPAILSLKWYSYMVNRTGVVMRFFSFLLCIHIHPLFYSFHCYSHQMSQQKNTHGQISFCLKFKTFHCQQSD